MVGGIGVGGFGFGFGGCVLVGCCYDRLLCGLLVGVVFVGG